MKNNLFVLVCSLVSIPLIVFVIYSLSDTNVQPDNTLIHYELTLHDAGKYKQVYADAMKQDKGNQPFQLSFRSDGKDMKVYVLADSTAKEQALEYVNWLVGYYGAKVG